MKRFGNLFQEATRFESLLHAFKRARRGCTRSPSVLEFEYHLEGRLLELGEELRSGAYCPGAYHYFTILDPKERLIAVAPFRDRVVHHAVIQVLEPLYERIFIHDSYATRPSKGVHAAIERSQRFVRRWPWYLKMDIEKYFDSVAHEVLLSMLESKFKDRKLLTLLKKIIANSLQPGMGLPIGNLTSQFLANVYLDPFDHWVKEHLRVRGYLRYMDDFVLFADSRTKLGDLRSACRERLSGQLRLRVKERSEWLNRSAHGLSFLGMRIFPSTIRVRRENRRRSLRKLAEGIRLWHLGEIDESAMVQSLTSIVGHLRYFSPHQRICGMTRGG